MVEAIMFDNIKVAIGVKEPSGVQVFVLEPDLPEILIPQDLFLGRDRVSIFEVAAWVEERVFPPDRIGVKRLLRSLKLKQYDAWEIALKTRACLMEDGFWLKVHVSDTYESHTIRGRFGNKAWPKEHFFSLPNKPVEAPSFPEHWPFNLDGSVKPGFEEAAKTFFDRI